MTTTVSPMRQAANDAWEAYQATPTQATQLAYQQAWSAYVESPEAYRARGGMSYEGWLSS